MLRASRNVGLRCLLVDKKRIQAIVHQERRGAANAIEARAKEGIVNFAELARLVVNTEGGLGLGRGVDV